MSRFLIGKYQSLEAYVPGEQPKGFDLVKLNTNESPYAPAPEVVEVITSTEVERLRLYSDPECAQLKETAAEIFGLDKSNFVFSNGSDDILNFAFMAFAGDEKTAHFADITYGFYKVLAQLHSINCNVIPLKEDFSIDVDEYIGLDGLIVVANPNAPTGIALPKSEIERIVISNPNSVVLVDEAYVDFGGESCIDLVKKYKNLVVVMTFSKSRSLAGGRLGFAAADEELIADINRIRDSMNPYSVNRLTSLCGVAALKSGDYYKERCALIAEDREFTKAELEKRGFTVLKSKANFLFAQSTEVDGETLYLELKKRGVLVRHFTSGRISNFNRITIGTKEQMLRLLSAVDEIIREINNNKR